VDKPKARRADVRPPTADELSLLLQGADAAEDRLLALWTLAIYSGCRQGELLGLSWDDVDLDHGTMTVRRELVAVHAHVPQFGDPKSQTSRRTLSLPAVAVAALRAHKARQKVEQSTAAVWADNNLAETKADGAAGKTGLVPGLVPGPREHITVLTS
jgi:integrase